jgi:hypothetical protein
MPRYIDAEIMPHGPLWEQLTDNEKINVLSYLLSSPSVDVVKEIFYYICGNVVHIPRTPEDMLVTSRQEFEKVLKKYNIEGIEF